MSQDHAQGLIRISFVNPESGGPKFPSIGFGAIMLRPGGTVTLPKRTTSSFFHAVESEGHLTVEGGDAINWIERDTGAIPDYSEVVLSNGSADKPAFLITTDE